MCRTLGDCPICPILGIDSNLDNGKVVNKIFWKQYFNAV
jgi:hypothetical protein